MFTRILIVSFIIGASIALGVVVHYALDTNPLQVVEEVVSIQEEILEPDFTGQSFEATEQEPLVVSEVEPILTAFYTTATVNVRECPELACRILGTYPRNTEIDLPYGDLGAAPVWVEVDWMDDEGVTSIAYVSKSVLSDEPIMLPVETKPVSLPEEVAAIPPSSVQAAPPSGDEPPAQDEQIKQATSSPGNGARLGVATDSIGEVSIDITTIVLVRCTFRSQYHEASSQPWNEERYNVGSGVVISDQGHIVTVNHVLEVDTKLQNDPSGRVWKRTGCKAALNDYNQTPIPAYALFGGADDPRFKDAEIIWQPTADEYNEAYGLDVALIKIDANTELSAEQLFPYVVTFAEADPLLVIGYPGKIVLTPQTLERFDGNFVATTYYPKSSCASGVVPCGLRYVSSRDTSLYQQDFWKKTEFGIVTPAFRGGFSGAPVFYKGHVVGIVTHMNNKDGRENVVLLTSYDIVETLKKYSLGELIQN